MFALPCRLLPTRLPTLATRLLPALCFAQYTKILQKKPKSPAVESEPSIPSADPLSPEQLERIARNKRAALERLSTAQTPPGFGQSWRSGLSAEFGKPYFKQVRAHVVFGAVRGYSKQVFFLPQLMGFVAEERKKHTIYPPAEQVFTWTQMCDIRDVSLSLRSTSNVTFNFI